MRGKRGKAVVRLAEPAADRPRAGVLIAIFAAAATIGTALPWAVAHAPWPAAGRTAIDKTVRAAARGDASVVAAPGDSATPSRAPKPSPATVVKDATLAAVPRTASATALGAPAPAPAPAPATAPAVAIASDQPPAPIVPRTTPSAPKAAAKLERGFVAYLHCDGLERPGRRFPCPRDPALEAQVWRILHDLAQCTDDNPGAGSAEVRLTWHGSEPPKIELRSPEPPPSRNLQAVSKCAERAFLGLRPRLRSARLMVSFRFELH